MHPTLAQLPAGRIARVTDLRGCAESCQRLKEMGFTRGTLVEVLLRGTPSLIRLRHGRVTLSSELAHAVLVG